MGAAVNSPHFEHSVAKKAGRGGSVKQVGKRIIFFQINKSIGLGGASPLLTKLSFSKQREREGGFQVGVQRRKQERGSELSVNGA